MIYTGNKSSVYLAKKKKVRKIKGRLEIFKIMSTNFVVKENLLEEVIEFSHVNLGFSRNTA